MKKLLLATSAIYALAIVGPAGAADMPLKAPRPLPPVTTWSGCYIGGHAGYSWSRWQDNNVPNFVEPDANPNPIAFPGDPLVFGYTGSFDTDGFAGGVQFGCDYQYGAFVIGAVIDASWTSQNQTSAAFDIIPVPPAPDSANELASVKLKSYGTARARLGWTNGSALFYVTGGLAWARAQVSYEGEGAIGGVPVGVFAVSNDAYHLGWSAGLGLEYMFSSNWTIGVEYLHLDVGNANYLFGTTFPNVTITTVLGSGTNFDLRTDVVRATLNYRFGALPIAARY